MSETQTKIYSGAGGKSNAARAAKKVGGVAVEVVGGWAVSAPGGLVTEPKAAVAAKVEKAPKASKPAKAPKAQKEDKPVKEPKAKSPKPVKAPKVKAEKPVKEPRAAKPKAERKPRVERDWSVRPVITAATAGHINGVLDKIEAARGDAKALKALDTFKRTSTYYNVAGRFLDACVAEAKAKKAA